MNAPPLRPSPPGWWTPPVRITLIYVVVGALWILFSDELVAHLAGNLATATAVSILKGLFYVLFTAALLFTLIERHTAALVRSAQALGQSEELQRNPDKMSQCHPPGRRRVRRRRRPRASHPSRLSDPSNCRNLRRNSTGAAQRANARTSQPSPQGEGERSATNFPVKTTVENRVVGEVVLPKSRFANSLDEGEGKISALTALCNSARTPYPRRSK